MNLGGEKKWVRPNLFLEISRGRVGCELSTQTVSYDASINPRHFSILPTVVFHPRFRHDIQTTAAVFYLTSSGRSARSSLYSRQAGVSGFWCHRLEQPASPRRICAVTRGFQTTESRHRDISVFQFLPRHYHMTRVLLSPFITTV